MMRALFSILLVTVSGYLVLCLIVYLFQSRLVFFPDKQVAITPAAVNLTYQDVTLHTSDAVLLHGWFIPHEESDAAVLFCHGNAGNIGHRLESVRVFHDLGLNVFIFDYRGYGNSAGTIDEPGSYRDARAAWDYLSTRHDIDPARIFIFGRSLGSAVAAELARHVPPAGLILESAFTSIPDLGQQLYPFLPVRLLSRIKYPTKTYLQEISCPKLIIHSRDDEIIPFSQGRTNYESAPDPKSFLEINGGHNDGFIVSGTVYQAGLRTFLEAVVPVRKDG
jgi:hypothetical protein